MADITAKLVNELRGKTGLGMMECKKALTETAGDVDKAIEFFRKKGVKTSITERAANEGRVAVAVSADRRRGVIAEINCNTDFTAKSQPVAEVAEAATKVLLAHPTAAPGEDPVIKAKLIEVAQQTGENVQMGRTATLESTGIVATYLYSVGGKGRIAVLASVTGSSDDDTLRNLGMHIAAAKPLSVGRHEIPAELIAKEKEIAVEQAKATGKPQAIAEKIAEGKMNSFYAEKVLLDQEFINPEVFKGTVGAMLKGKGATVERFVRIEVGQ